MFAEPLEHVDTAPCALKHCSHYRLKPCLSYPPCSVTDALIAYVREDFPFDVGSDFFFISLQAGRVVMTFDNQGGLSNSDMVVSSTGTYSDTEIHQIRLLFQDRVLEMLIDNTERVTLTCK